MHWRLKKTGEPTLTVERLREVLSYDDKTGQLTWIKRVNFRYDVGHPAGTPYRNGYIVVRLDGRAYQAHRLAWLHFFGRWPVDEIDHIDRNPTNNAISNLRESNRRENNWNKTRAPRGYFRVAASGKYRAQISIDGKRKMLGTFSSEEEARAAYVAATIAHCGIPPIEVAP